MKIRILYRVVCGLGLAAILSPLGTLSAQAEGSKELTANGGYRPWLMYRNANETGTSVLRRTVLYAYAVAGETINMGSSVTNAVNRFYWYAPDGTSATNNIAGGVGIISNRTQEVAGPLPNAGGYNPRTVTVGPGQTGIWEIHFVSPDFADTEPTSVLAGDPWTQPNTRGNVAAWDVTVRSAGGTAIPGRAFTTLFAATIGDWAVNAMNSQVYFLTYEGFEYKIDLNGLDPFRFLFFANSRGFTTNGVSAFRSVAQAGAVFQNPLSPDTATDKTHKMFFNQPDASLPMTATTRNGTTFTGSTWLRNIPGTVTASSLALVGVDGTTNQVGSALGGNFTFLSTAPGTYIINIDLNGNGSYTDAVDRVLLGPAVSGANTVFWDGRDGQGNPAPPSGNPSTFSSRVTVANGEIHFPFLDAEAGPNGLKVQRLNGPVADRNQIFWNDTGVFAGGTQALPPAGADSTSGAHTWGTSPSSNSGVGNEKGIDTWVFVPGSYVSSPQVIVVKQTDLEVVSKTRTPVVVSPGTNVIYDIVIRNNGPQDTPLARFFEQFPPGLSNVVLVSSNFTGNAKILSGVFSNGTYDARVQMAANEMGTLTFRGTAMAGLGGILTNVAKFLSYDDVGDTDDLTRVGAGNNSKTNISVVSYGINGFVYNDANVNATRDGGENGTTLTLYAKLISTNAPGTAVQAVAVDPSTGAYTLTATSVGGYTVIIDDNATLSDVTPFLPTGWLGTETPGQTRAVTVADNVSNVNFGLYNGSYLVVSKSANPAAFNSAGVTTFSLTITNSSSVSNAITSISDVLPNRPTNITYVAGSSAFNGVGIANPTIVNVTNLTWNGSFSIPANSARTLTFNANVLDVDGAYTNRSFAFVDNTRIDATTNTADNVPATAIVIAANLADLQTTKTAGSSSVDPTNTLSYTIAVTNLGPAIATNVVVNDTLPPGTTFISASNSGNTNGIGQVVWPAISTLVSNAGVSYTVNIRAPIVGILTNVAYSTSPVFDPAPGNNTNSVVTPVNLLADLQITKTGATNINAGAQLLYTLAITNRGPSSATNIVVQDTLPVGAAFFSASDSGATNGSGQVVWPAISILASNAGVNYTVTITAPGSGILTNVAAVSSPVTDPVLGNNTGTLFSTIAPSADLSITKTPSVSPVAATNQFSYSILVSNAGPSTATSLVVTDSLPAGVTFLSATPVETGTNGSNQVFWTLPDLGANASTSLTLFVRAPAQGTITNIATAGSPLDPTPPVTTNTVDVSESADVSILKTAPDTIAATNQFDYTIVVSNAGPSIASSLVVTDSLPTVVTFLSASVVSLMFIGL